MHVVVAALYAFVLWLALVVFIQQVGGPWFDVLACGPLVVSAVIVVLCAIELLIALARIIVTRVADGVREWWAISRR